MSSCEVRDSSSFRISINSLVKKTIEAVGEHPESLELLLTTQQEWQRKFRR